MSYIYIIKKQDLNKLDLDKITKKRGKKMYFQKYNKKETRINCVTNKNVTLKEYITHLELRSNRGELIGIEYLNII